MILYFVQRRPWLRGFAEVREITTARVPEGAAAKPAKQAACRDHLFSSLSTSTLGLLTAEVTSHRCLLGPEEAGAFSHHRYQTITFRSYFS